jgi:RHS repeat-associated protein
LGNNREVWNGTQNQTVQVTNYYPSGLPWKYETEQVQPYMYNDKEFVEMFGLDNYDYGFRGYYPAIGRFTTIDPLAEKYYSISPYAYCANNPMIFIDPSGKKPVWNGQYGDESKYIDDVTNNEVTWGDVQNYINYGNYNGKQPLENSNSESSHTITPFRVGLEWLSGTGERNRIFVNGDVFTELLKEHDFISDYKKILSYLISKGNLSGTTHYKLSGVEGIGKYIKDYSTLLTGGLTGNLAVTYLGSYNLTWSVINKDGNTATVLFEIKNSSTMQSASRPPIIGYWGIWQNTVGSVINNAFSSGAGSKTTQTFIWTEKIPLQQ